MTSRAIHVTSNIDESQVNQFKASELIGIASDIADSISYINDFAVIGDNEIIVDFHLEAVSQVKYEVYLKMTLVSESSSMGERIQWFLIEKNQHGEFMGYPLYVNTKEAPTHLKHTKTHCFRFGRKHGTRAFSKHICDTSFTLASKMLPEFVTPNGKFHRKSDAYSMGGM